MKKIVPFLLVLTLLILASCAKTQPSAQEQQEPVQAAETKTEPAAQAPAPQPDPEPQQDSPAKEDPKPEQEQEQEQEPEDSVIRLVDDGTGESGNQDGMEKTVVLTAKQIEHREDADPMRLTVNAVQISTVTVSDGFSAMMLGVEVGKPAALIVIDVDAENMSSESVSFRPDTSMIVLNTSEKVSANELLSGDASGDYLGKDVKNGQVFFICESTAEEIETIRWRIDPPTNAALDTLGDGFDIQFEIER